MSWLTCRPIASQIIGEKESSMLYYPRCADMATRWRCESHRRVQSYPSALERRQCNVPCVGLDCALIGSSMPSCPCG